MTALKGPEIEPFLARPDPARPVVLLYGPDAGLVSERAEALVRASVDDPRDPFALVRLLGEDLAADPARLLDEAATQPLFGGRRAIWVRAGTRNIAASIEGVLDADIGNTRIVIEAGDLKRSAPLRAVAERARTVAVIPCYADAERDLARLVDGTFRVAELTITPDARATLIASLGSDRRVSRSEIEKLVLYAGNGPSVDLETVLAVVADVSALAIEEVVDAAFAEKVADMEAQFRRALEAGTAPGLFVGAALRHAFQLHKMRVAIDRGAPASEVIGPQVFFRRRPALEAALKAWSAGRLLEASAALARAALNIRCCPALAQAMAHRAMLAVARGSRGA